MQDPLRVGIVSRTGAQLIATMNEGKLREYQRLLGEVPGLKLETILQIRPDDA